VPEDVQSVTNDVNASPRLTSSNCQQVSNFRGGGATDPHTRPSQTPAG